MDKVEETDVQVRGTAILIAWIPTVTGLEQTQSRRMAEDRKAWKHFITSIPSVKEVADR